MENAVLGKLVVPDFAKFTSEVDGIFESCTGTFDGELASYIPQLAKVDPSLWAVSLCTVDGQRYDYGNADKNFTIQSAGKCFNYALFNSVIGRDKLHQYVGKEPSGMVFNMIALNSNNKPHNPLINSGAILMCSLLFPEISKAEKMDWVLDQYGKLCGGKSPNVDAPVYNSEKEHADRNYALGYLLKETKCFPPENFSLEEVLDLYFQLCSIEITCDVGAVMAGTFASGGVCPITGKTVLSQLAVRDTLTLMHSCGMYDLSGEFSYDVGLPAKSGVSGVIVAVVPDVMGMCLYSPLINKSGNSVRGMEFCKKLVEKFKLHIYDKKDFSNNHCITS